MKKLLVAVFTLLFGIVVSAYAQTDEQTQKRDYGKQNYSETGKGQKGELVRDRVRLQDQTGTSEQKAMNKEQKREQKKVNKTESQGNQNGQVGSTENDKKAKQQRKEIKKEKKEMQKENKKQRQELRDERNQQGSGQKGK